MKKYVLLEFDEDEDIFNKESEKSTRDTPEKPQQQPLSDEIIEQLENVAIKFCAIPTNGSPNIKAITDILMRRLEREQSKCQ